MLRRWPLLVLSLAAFGCATAATVADPPADPLLSALATEAKNAAKGGFVVAEINGPHVSYALIGSPDTPAATPPEHRLFEIGSITKVFTGLLLAQAVLERKATLDDPIAKYLPASLTLDPKVAAITLLQLATHTSGLPSLPDNFAPADEGDPYADYSTERLYVFLQSYHPKLPPPQPADYSNVGAGLLGHILERICSRNYEQLVRDKITEPLGLTDTVITLTPEQERRFVTPYSGVTVVHPWRLDALAGAGALRSTAADMAKFVQALLDPKSLIAPAWTLARAPRARYGRRGRIGLGIMLAPRGPDTVYNHSGGTGGFRTYFEVVPARDQGTVVLFDNDTVEPGLMVATVRRAPAAPADPHNQ